MSRNTRYKSVLRAFEVLELIGSAYNGFRLNELVDFFGTDKTSSLHTMLYSLVKKGYLAKVSHPVRYVIGPAFGAVDQRGALGPLHQRLSPVMSSICKLSGMKVTYQQLVTGRGFVLFVVYPETYFNVRASDYISDTYGTPVIFQAYMTPKEQDEFWAAHPMRPLDQKIWGSFKNLRKYLKVAAKQRLAVIAPQHGEPFRVVGPIFDASGKVFAAISAIQVGNKLTQQQANTAAQLIHRVAVELSVSKPSKISVNLMPAYSAHGRCDCLPTDHTRR